MILVLASANQQGEPFLPNTTTLPIWLEGYADSSVVLI